MRIGVITHPLHINYEKFCIDYQKYGFDFIVKKYINEGLNVRCKNFIRKVLWKIRRMLGV